MPTTTTKKLVDRLHGAGLNLSVTKEGGLSVKPSARLNDDLRGLLRDNKAELVAWLMADKEQTLTTEAQLVEYRLYSKLQPPPAALNATPSTQDAPVEDWRELDRAYLAHHFTCKTCVAAGQGRGLRCGTGAALWVSYQDAAMTPTTKTKGAA